LRPWDNNSQPFDHHPGSQRWKAFVFPLAVSFFPWLIFQLCLTYLYQLERPGKSFWSAFVLVMGNPIAYWLLTPLVVLVSLRAIAVASRRSILHHLGGVLVFVALHPLLRCLFLPFRSVDGVSPISWAGYEKAAVWNFLTSFTVYAVVAGIATACGYYSEARKRALNQASLSADLAESKLQLLKNQIHPHFLFNILHDISGLMTSNPPAARRMMNRLQDLLHTVIDERSENLIPLARELSFVNCYLELEKMRLGERLTVHFDVEDQTLDAMIPNMVLQPLVENSIKHGIARFNRNGRLHISSKKEGADLRLVIEDNGPGINAAARRGVGLSNIEARLHHHYPKKLSIQYFNLPVQGLRCEIVIPFTAEFEGAANAR